MPPIERFDRAMRLPGVLKNDDTNSSQNVPSTARVAAGAFGFLTLIHAFDGPDLYNRHSERVADADYGAPAPSRRTHKFAMLVSQRIPFGAGDGRIDPLASPIDIFLRPSRLLMH